MNSCLNKASHSAFYLEKSKSVADMQCIFCIALTLFVKNSVSYLTFRLWTVFDFTKLTSLCLQVNFVAAIDVYEDGEAGLLLCYNCECPPPPSLSWLQTFQMLCNVGYLPFSSATGIKIIAQRQLQNIKSEGAFYPSASAI